MKIRIYQIKRDHEKRHDIAFMPLDVFNSEIGEKLTQANMGKYYSQVYEFEKDTGHFTTIEGILDYLFFVFNCEHPSDFRGHSLSISDIVALDDDYYFCDDVSWQKID